MKPYIHYKKLAKIAGLAMILVATIGFYVLKDAERVARSSWQTVYMAFVLIGGIFNLFDKDNEKRAKYACFSYITALLLSAGIGIAFLNGIHADFLLIGAVFLISLIRYGSILMEKGGKKPIARNDITSAIDIPLVEEAAKEKPIGQNQIKYTYPVGQIDKEERESAASDLLIDCKTYAQIASQSTNILKFLDAWDSMMLSLERLVMLEGEIDFKNRLPSEDLERMKSEFQEKLQVAIYRHKENAIFKMRENPSCASNEIDKFCDALKKSMDMQIFSSETAAFAQKASAEIGEILEDLRDECERSSTRSELDTTVKIDYEQILKDEAAWRREQMGQSVVEQELDRIDKMDGHTFERWCARLLEASGFKDVEVTRGSGDQGVDVLATLDGIRYAVQCKCYASDLGNKPVQEVYAGITIYKCQLGSVMTNRRFTAGAKELAEATGISLWDRDWITSLLEELDADAFPL